MGLESREITFVGYRVDQEEPSHVQEDLVVESGQENILFEPQIVQGPKKLDFEYQEFSAEFL